ncbi:MAG: DUF3189 family protein [Bacillota bacterium]
MRLVYYNSQGLPLAAVAAAIRTGRLPSDASFEAAELLSLPLINFRRAFVFYGTDSTGMKVYAFWCNADPRLVHLFFQARGELYRQAEEWSLRPVDEIPGSTRMALAWRLARSGRPYGRSLFYRAVLKSYPHFLELTSKDP